MARTSIYKLEILYLFKKNCFGNICQIMDTILGIQDIWANMSTMLTDRQTCSSGERYLLIIVIQTVKI